MSSIALQVNVVVYLKGAMALYLVILGFSTASSVDINMAFGSEFRGYGTGLVWMGMFSGLACIPHKWSTTKHNRFGLVFTFIVDTLVLAIQLSVGFQIFSYIAPLFPKDLQIDCLRFTPLTYDLEGACQEFFKSDRTAGMYGYWKYWYTKRADPLAFQKITVLEGDTCCGFYTPYRCQEMLDTSPFPANRDVSGVDPDLSGQRVYCSTYKDIKGATFGSFYTPKDDCQDLYDIVNNIVGGCVYDLGLGYCLKREITADSSGCGSKVEDLMIETITPIAYFVIGSVALNLYCMLLACCMWWKRKANDVFPDIKLAPGQVVYEDVRDQFEVKPQHNVLVKKGFLPETDKVRLKYLLEEEVKEQATSMHLSAKRAGPGSGGGGGEEGKVPDDEGPLPPDAVADAGGAGP